MSVKDEAERLATFQPLMFDGYAKRDDVTSYEQWACVFCGAETVEGYDTETKHHPSCPWLSMPAIVSALAREARLVDALEEIARGSGTWPCARFTSIAREALAATARPAPSVGGDEGEER